MSHDIYSIGAGGRMKTCENCGSRVYSLGCTWCNEEAYIEQQTHFDALCGEERPTDRRDVHAAARFTQPDGREESTVYVTKRR